MIDLKKDQLLTEPIKCWVKDRNGINARWMDRWLIGISNGFYRTIKGANHSDNVNILDIFGNGITSWRNCTLTDPDPTPEESSPRQWITVKDVPSALWGKVWVKHESRPDNYATIFTPRDTSTPEGTLCPGYVWSDDVNPIGATWHKRQSDSIDAVWCKAQSDPIHER